MEVSLRKILLAVSCPASVVPAVILVKACYINPRRVAAHERDGYTHLIKNEFDLAINDFDQALRLNSISTPGYAYRGLAFLKKSQLDKAIADFSRAIQLNPKDAPSRANRGIAYA